MAVIAARRLLGLALYHLVGDRGARPGCAEASITYFLVSRPSAAPAETRRRRPDRGGNAPNAVPVTPLHGERA